MSIMAVASIGGSLISGAMSNSAADKAAAATRDAASASQIDLYSLDQKTRQMALQNAIDSRALENNFTPEVPQLRRAANINLLQSFSQTDAEKKYQKMLEDQVGQPIAGKTETPLLSAAIAKAQSDLALGGKLPQDVQNLVTRQAMANGGSVANGANISMGRDMAARDLGLTSLNLENQRLQNAAQLGGQELNSAQFNVGTQFNNAANLINQLQMLRSLRNDQFGRTLNTAQYGQSIQQPVVGLDPSAVASIYGANASNRGAALANQANIYGANSNSWLGMAGNLAGYGMMSYAANNRNSGSSGNSGGGSSYGYSPYG